MQNTQLAEQFKNRDNIDASLPIMNCSSICGRSWTWRRRNSRRHTALGQGTDVDQPRKLAKSATVE
jgi:hypothetical protein